MRAEPFRDAACRPSSAIARSATYSAQGGNGSALGAGTGGAIDVYASTTAITNSTFTGNEAIGSNGGVGGYVGEAEGGAINTYSTLSINNSTFLHNAVLAGSNGNSGTGTPGPFLNYAFGGRSGRDPSQHHHHLQHHQ